MSEPAESLESIAARWFARRRSGEMSEQEARALEAWLEGDAAHRLAYDVVARAWAGAGVMRSAPEILTLRAKHRRGPGVWSRYAPRALAAALALIAVSGIGVWAARQGAFDLHRLPNQTFQTGVGERTKVMLPDGSVVTLNTDTVLRTKASPHERLLVLEKGQAFFQVAKDPSRPFRVTAAGRTVTAVGTAFDVRVDKDRFEVTLVEGRVKVETPVARETPAAPARVQTSELVAGSRFVAVDDRRWSVDRTDAAKETTWVTGWLTFDREPLGKIVGELSRYSERRIVLDDPALNDVPVSGRFKPEDVDAFVRALETYNIARVESDTPMETRLTTP